jgi:hypothetical protein
MLFIEPAAVSLQDQINQLIVSILTLVIPLLTAYVTKRIVARKSARTSELS